MAADASCLPFSQDEYWMHRALFLARMAQANGEVPVGALLLDPSGNCVSRAFNQPISLNDPSAHAEVLALREASSFSQNYRLPGFTLYVTLEPCAMCAGAIIHTRLARVVFGAFDFKTGCCGSVCNLFAPHLSLNHHTLVVGGVLQPQCSTLLSQFFLARRHAAKKNSPE